MKSRKLGIALLLMLALVVTSGTFAYWASSITQASPDSVTGNTVTIGTGNAVTLTLTATAGTTAGSGLIPSGYGTDGTDDTATFEFSVVWDEDVAGAGYTTADLAVSYANVVAGTLADPDVNFSWSDDAPATITLGATGVTVTVTVVFDVEPADATEYAKIAGQNFTFDVTFTVSNPS